ncbi:MAG: hypothetical protein HON72_04970 [Porticoccaceae bacterium]|jgi:hypothetical protein|nr:hypothetical protein [Porticoccaceae bacterium]MDB2533248.1 hypothetical protein [Porticoccaceae bacterium]MDC0640971.1 hypothetical protein [Porticoccaceae bacterium]
MSTPEDEQNNVDEPQIDEAGLDGSEDAVSEETSEPEQIQESAEDKDISAADQERFAHLLKNAKDISGRLEVLVPGVLDTADATNSAADVSRRASSALENGLDHLQKRVNELVDASAKSATLSARILLGSVSALLVAIGLFVFMSFQLSDRVAQVDGMMVAISKRVVQMNAGLTNFEKMNYSINQLAIKQAQFASNQKLLVQAVTNAEAATKNLNVQVPDAAAKSVGVETNKLAVQVKSLKSTLSSQGAQLDKVASSVVALGSQLKSFEGQVDNVSKLNADVEALITLERDKYLDLLRRQVEIEESRLPVEEELEEEIDDSIVVYPYVSAR